ncbi:hypothetical protein N8461_02060 [Akkermansiaceae bacterium]|nr:hypothetical protein [Akkermansiaceae bacterium]MDA7651856.1 hypothetical protein [Akkermansiaceae bacterium]
MFRNAALFFLTSLFFVGENFAEEATIEWDYKVIPTELWQQANLVDVIEQYADGKGGGGALLSAAYRDNGNWIGREFLLLLDSDGQEKFRWQIPNGTDFKMVILTPTTVIFKTNNNGESILHNLSFESDGSISEILNPISEAEASSLAFFNLERPSYFPLISAFANEDKSFAILRKRSLGQNVSTRLATILFSGFDSGNSIISWESKVGAIYQVQKSSDLENWSNVGLRITGTGDPMNYSEAVLGGKLYLRVVNP